MKWERGLEAEFLIKWERGLEAEFDIDKYL